MMPTNLIAAGLLSAILVGCSDQSASGPARNASASLQANSVAAPARPVLASNNEWLTLKGKVIATAPDSFLLDYGPGQIGVEMDDWDRFHEGRLIVPGDIVTVSGRLDADPLQKRTIEAATVYVQGLGAHFLANGSDEEDLARTVILIPGEKTYVGATGKVTAKEGSEFEIGALGTSVRVDTAKLQDRTKALQKVGVGDRVQVWGTANIDPNERTEIMAKGLKVLAPEASKDVQKT